MASLAKLSRFAMSLRLPNPRLMTLYTSTIHRSLASQADRQKSTIDPKEVAKFAANFAQSDFWWKSRDGAPLRALNELRVPLIRDNLVDGASKTAKPLANLKLIEVGSGGGLLCEPLARLGANVVGLDPVQEHIRISNSHLDDAAPNLKPNLVYNCTTVEEFSSVESNRNSFDGLIASEVLEHVDDVELFLECAHRLLKPSGRLFLTTINQTAASYLLGILVAENVFNLVPKGTHSYDRFVPLNGLVIMLEKIGFNVDLIQGMMFNPVSGRWSWSRNTLINYSIVATKA